MPENADVKKAEDKKPNCHEGHRERMRERFRREGFIGFEDHQVLELLLFYTCPRKDTNELAHFLLNRFGSIAGVFNASYEELEEIKGITANTATLFKVIAGALPIYYSSHNSGLVYDNTDKLKELFKPYFVGVGHEVFRLACFDNNLRVLSNIPVSSGGPSSADVKMRKMVEELIRVNSSHAVIAHNHPKGLPNPSREDIAVTRTINSTFRALGVQLLDHIIVGESSAVSMREVAGISVFE